MVHCWAFLIVHTYIHTYIWLYDYMIIRACIHTYHSITLRCIYITIDYIHNDPARKKECAFFFPEHSKKSEALLVVRGFSICLWIEVFNATSHLSDTVSQSQSVQQGQKTDSNVWTWGEKRTRNPMLHCFPHWNCHVGGSYLFPDTTFDDSESVELLKSLKHQDIPGIFCSPWSYHSSHIVSRTIITYYLLW